MGKFRELIDYHPDDILFKAEGGNPMMKSIEIESHFQMDISRGLSSPSGL